jgi:hypothetical protein
MPLAPRAWLRGAFGAAEAEATGAAETGADGRASGALFAATSAPGAGSLFLQAGEKIIAAGIISQAAR